jgi:hypothetical protein
MHPRQIASVLVFLKQKMKMKMKKGTKSKIPWQEFGLKKNSKIS